MLCMDWRWSLSFNSSSTNGSALQSLSQLSSPKVETYLATSTTEEIWGNDFRYGGGFCTNTMKMSTEKVKGLLPENKRRGSKEKCELLDQQRSACITPERVLWKGCKSHLGKNRKPRRPNSPCEVLFYVHDHTSWGRIQLQSLPRWWLKH